MLIKETLRLGIVDSVSMKIVHVKTWLNAFLDALVDKERSPVKYFLTDTKLKFGELKFPLFLSRKKL